MENGRKWKTEGKNDTNTSNETHKRDLQKRPAKETYKTDPQKRLDDHGEGHHKIVRVKHLSTCGGGKNPHIHTQSDPETKETYKKTTYETYK